MKQIYPCTYGININCSFKWCIADNNITRFYWFFKKKIKKIPIVSMHFSINLLIIYFDTYYNYNYNKLIAENNIIIIGYTSQQNGQPLLLKYEFVRNDETFLRFYDISLKSNISEIFYICSDKISIRVRYKRSTSFGF